MEIRNLLTGTVEVMVTCADTGGILNRITREGIEITNAVLNDELSITFTASRLDWDRLKRIVCRYGGQCRVQNDKGLYRPIFRFLGHPVLICTVCFLFFLTCYLPGKILFVTVEGNRSVSDETVLAAAQSCGVAFGTTREQIRNEQVKNGILSQVEQLRWVGVNTHGCVAVICVEEKTKGDRKTVAPGVRSIVANRDGIIREITVVKGNPLFRVGEAVEEGQMLVSGYTDCTFSTKVEAADGEVYGDTNWELEAVTPLERLKRGEMRSVSRSCRLLFGKNLINLWKDSGISVGSCVKIEKKYTLTLPGGFSLPVTLIVTTVTDYALNADFRDPDVTSDCVKQTARDYLLEQTVAGRILSEETDYQWDDRALYLSGNYACREMIGKIMYEEILTANEKRD